MTRNEGVPTSPGSNHPDLLLHAAGPLDAESLAGVLRNSANARAALKRGAEILAYANSLRSAGLEAGDLTVGIGTVPAAVTHLAERQ